MKTLKPVFSVQLMNKESAMKEYKIGVATVRIHGNADPEKVKKATEKYLKKVERSRKIKK